MSRVLTKWLPEDHDFWHNEGKAVARLNLWISIPCLLLSFAVWMVWSVVVVNLPNIGFKFDTDQLFWLAALPGRQYRHPWGPRPRHGPVGAGCPCPRPTA